MGKRLLFESLLERHSRRLAFPFSRDTLPNEDFHREASGGSARKKAFTIGVDSVMDS